MRIATWNVNGIRARLDYFLQWLRDRRPDIVGLQELKVVDEKFPRGELEAAGYRVVLHGQKAWNGVAIVSRREGVVRQIGLPGQEESGARFLTADFQEFSFTTVYCPNGKAVSHADFPRKLAWFDALAEHLRAGKDRDRPAILCGDFNICPAALDTWNEEEMRGQIFHTEQERDRFRRLLDGGFHDLFRETHPDRREFSWWDYRGGSFHRGLGLRIDFLLATETLLSRVGSVEIDRDFRKKREGLTPSDHAPVIMDLDLSNP